jgi:hypothetical protein
VLATLLIASPSVVVVARVAPLATATVSASMLESAAIAAARWFVDLAIAAPGDVPRGLEEELRGCRNDNRCVGARLQAAGIDRALYVVANVESRPVLLSVELIAADTGRSIATELSPVRGSLSDVVGLSVRRLLSSAGHSLGARLLVDPQPVDARLALDPAAPLEARVPSVVPAGRYRLLADAPGHRREERELELEPGGEVTIELTLEEKAVLETWWLWTIVGAAVVIGAGAGIAAVEWPRKRVLVVCPGGEICE